MLLCRTLKIRRAAIIVNSKTRPGGLDGISSIKIAEKVKLFSERCNCVSQTDFPLTSHNCVFPQNIRLFSLSLEHISEHISNIYYFSAICRQKSVIWVVFGKQRLIIRNAIASVAIRNGSQI